MRHALLAAATASLLLFGGGVAQASQDPPEANPPAEFAPPAPAPVVDTDTAAAFAKLYAAQNARRFLRERDRRRVRVIDVASSCLQSPLVDTRFGCVFTLRALVIQRERGWWHWGHGSKARHSSKGGRRGDDRRHRRFRVRQFGCLGALRINGGPTATPTVDNVNVECGRIPRGDMMAPEPEPTG